MSRPESSRSYVDGDGVEWTVREIGASIMTGALGRMLDHDRRRGGWMVFESAGGEKRRLAPYPPDWRALSTYELERWCMRAVPVPAGQSRRAQD